MAERYGRVTSINGYSWLVTCRFACHCPLSRLYFQGGTRQCCRGTARGGGTCPRDAWTTDVTAHDQRRTGRTGAFDGRRPLAECGYGDDSTRRPQPAPAQAGQLGHGGVKRPVKLDSRKRGSGRAQPRLSSSTAAPRRTWVVVGAAPLHNRSTARARSHGRHGRGARPAPSFKARKSIRSSATRSAATLPSSRSYVAHRIRGGFSGG
jgi:hypothetical protein